MIGMAGGHTGLMQRYAPGSVAPPVIIILFADRCITIQTFFIDTDISSLMLVVTCKSPLYYQELRQL